MLANTFCHIPTLGLKSEARLWEAGVRSWDDLLAAANGDATALLGKAKHERALETIRASVQAFAEGRAEWFAQRLPSQEQWRLYREFRDNAAYLDIETTGLGEGDDHITTIALWDGNRLRTYVHGRNLGDFPTDVEDYSLLVTFNGKCFDVPFLRRAFGIALPQAHLDLRYALKAAGVSGGLKRCEKHFGLDRGELDGVDGYWAVLLWRQFQLTRDEAFLETLLAYNVEDVLSLHVLAALAYNLLLEKTPFALSHQVKVPALGASPYTPSPKVLNAIRRAYFQRY